MFAYCDNNPIIRADNEGDIWHVAVGFLIGAGSGALISAGVSMFSQYVTTGSIDYKVVAVNAVSGAISGVIACTGIGLVGSVCSNAIIGAGTYIAEQVVQNKKPDVKEIVLNGLSSGICGGLMGGKGADAKTLVSTWNQAERSITRESRRAFRKYAVKRTATYTATKSSVKSSIGESFVRYIGGTISNMLTKLRYKF